MKRILCAAAAMAISTAALMPAQAMAQVNVGVFIGQAPPPPRYEVVPAPRRGYEWAPGYWDWNGRRHVWRVGHWERIRAGQHYQRPEWQHGKEGWHLNHGGWQQAQRHERQEERPDRRGDDRGGRFCPPGQAKKGEC
ncbi:MAG: repeat family protein [Herminiimonas sp.]|nr:repeat family protein [Herminiimonas sp.]